MERGKLGIWAVIVMALALFSGHFGVGDVMFPAKLGQESGVVWWISGLGYFVVNALITYLAYLAIAKDRVSIIHMGSEIIHPIYGKVFGTILMLVIGPVFILPRVSSAVHEMSVIPFFPDAPLAVTLAIFFILNAWVSLNRAAVIDRLGKVLSPALILFLLLVAVKGIISPISSPLPTGVEPGVALGYGFTYGYNTMNAIGAVLFGAWVLDLLSRRGIDEPSEQRRVLVAVGGLTAALLGVTQMTLTYLGASTGAVYQSATIGELMVKITTHLYGRAGLGIFAVLLALACFTTSAGLTAAAGRFFEELTANRLKYRTTVVLSSLVGFALGNVGLSRIVRYAVPWLTLCYPALVVIIAGTLFTDVRKTRLTLAGGVIAALVFGLFEALGVAGYNVPWATAILAAVPLGKVGFAWVVPTLVGLVIGHIIQRIRGQSEGAGGREG